MNASDALEPVSGECLVALGANLGDPDRAIVDAIGAIGALATGPIAASHVIRSAAVGGPSGQGEFCNAVVRLPTDRDPAGFMEELLVIERRLGRERRTRWAARAIDLDLLLFGSSIERNDGLTLPHPRMSFRPFVVEPAAEVAPDWVHPECGRTLAKLAETLRSGADAVRLVGDDGAVAEAVHSMRPRIEIREANPAETLADERLTIDARPNPWPLPPSGPRLVLADGPAEHWQDEVAAALECVWPAA